jgi:hypothetical protein
VIISERSTSEVDGREYDVNIHLNPGKQEAEGVLSKSIEHAIRGYVREEDGFVVIWDAYVLDHGSAVS